MSGQSSQSVCPWNGDKFIRLTREAAYLPRAARPRVRPDSGSGAARLDSYEAVRAAGAHGVQAAWPHIVRIIERERSDKPLLLAAIEAIASIRPDEADDVLCVLSDLDDEEIEEAIIEALGVAGAELDDEGDEEDEEDKEDF